MTRDHAHAVRQVARLKVANSAAEVHYRIEKGGVIVEQIVNADYGFRITCTTDEGTAFAELAAACAAIIERADGKP